MPKSSSYRNTKRSQTDARTEKQAEQEPFFAPQSIHEVKQPAFFQAKLTVGKADDKHEQEADKVADSVVQKKPVGEIQRLATPEDDEKFSTNDERTRYHRLIRTKQEVQLKCADCAEEDKKKPEVQRTAEKEKDKKPEIQKAIDKDKKPVQKAVEKDKEKQAGIQRSADKEKKERNRAPKKEEEKTAGIQRATDKEKKDAVQRFADIDKRDKPVQKKGESTKSNVPEEVSNRILGSKGQGNQMSEQAKSEMEHLFGTGFSKVKIHTDTQAAEMSDELHAQAFTHGNDIYFNEGKFNPDSPEGKHLLAHELTHVVQQGGADKRKPKKE